MKTLASILAFLPLMAAADPVALQGKVARWEADCTNGEAGRWSCGAPKRSIGEESFRLILESPAHPGEASQAALTLGNGVRIHAYLAWPPGEDPVIQTKVEPDDGSLCAATSTVSPKKLPPLICATRKERLQSGITVSDLTLTPSETASGTGHNLPSRDPSRE